MAEKAFLASLVLADGRSCSAYPVVGYSMSAFLPRCVDTGPLGRISDDGFGHLSRRIVGRSLSSERD